MSTLLQGPRLYLRRLTEADATERYAQWLNDPEVNRYLESRYTHADPESLIQFIRTCNENPGIHLFGIFEAATHRHIGNIKLGPVDSRHRLGDIGLLIGEKDCWGKGYAAEAIELICTYGFGTLQLHKITASMYSENRGSFQAFIKNGFMQEGLLKHHLWIDSRFTDKILLGKICP